MRGAAITFWEELERQYTDVRWDGLIATDMMNLAEFLALTRPKFDRVPVLLYMHENQVGYPLHPEERRDYHYALTNFISILSATKVVFNSEYNRQEFFSGIRSILSEMPDYRPSRENVDSIESSCQIIPPAVDLLELDAPRKHSGDVPVILWNHRWERDKQPERFAEATAHKHSLIRFHVCSSRKDELSLEISPVACIMGEPDFAAEINREIIS